MNINPNYPAADVRFVGPAEDIRALRAELEAANEDLHFDRDVYGRSGKNDVYPILAGYTVDTELFRTVVQKYPRVEYCCTVPLIYGVTLHCSKNLGGHELGIYEGNMFYSYEVAGSTQTHIQLREGSRVISYERNGMPKWQDQAFSLSLLSEFCKYTKKKTEKQNFIKQLLSEIGSFANVKSVTVKLTETISASADSAQAREEIEKYRPFLPEPSLLNFIYATVEKRTTLVYDPDTMQMKQTDAVSVYAPQHPLKDQYQYVEYPISEETKTYPIVGSLADEKGFIFLKKTETSCICSACVTDAETIVIPENVFGKVVGLGDDCIVGLKNTKKIILPSSLTSFGAGNFRNCKKLKQVVFADAPDSTDDLIIRKKKQLKGLVTLNKSADVPADITEIGKFAFASCPQLTEIRLQSPIKEIHKDAFSGCDTLKTLILTEAVRKIDPSVLAKTTIKEIILANGDKVENPLLFPYLISSESGVVFSYADCLKNLRGIGAESKRISIAKKLLFHHMEFLGDSVSGFAEYLMEYGVRKNDLKLVNKIIEKNIFLQLDLEKLVSLSNENGFTEMTAVLLSLHHDDEVEVKRVHRIETPAPKAEKQLYIKVRFPNNRTYPYLSDYQVDIGDKVFVEGKMENIPGEVVFVEENLSHYAYPVVQAFNIKEETWDSIYSLDLDLE